MSVRRLADDSIQPQAFAFSNDNAAWAQKKIAQYPTGRQQSAVIPLLWRAQEQEGWLSRSAIESIAKLLGMAYIRVLEVATFYTQFLLKPVGSKAHVLICGTTPCMLRGAEDLRDVCQHHIHNDPFMLNEAGTLSWEEVECLGACVNAPMVMIGNDTYEDLTPQRMREILVAFETGNGDSIKPGTQIERGNSAAEGGATTLLVPPSKTREKFSPPVPPATPEQPAAVAAPQAATSAAKPRDVTEESAPAIKGPAPQAKVSEAKAEGERAAAAAAANADGEPNRAMREDATGAESSAGKIDGGRAPGKPTAGAPSENASATKAEPVTTDPVPGSTALLVAPAGAADNLKLISGVGPKLEARLNALGITKWSQVAELTETEIAKVEGTLNFRGRIGRDKWLEQAKALATGGAAEYLRVFGKDPK
ncbi:MAG: nuoE [Devosia sp.]|nr:nuoE [Devosia sp.]